jgi:Ni2+-binding GTPase involved in maturation of urease and hydrogenase
VLHETGVQGPGNRFGPTNDFMRLITVSGPPSTGKTAVTSKALLALAAGDWKVGVVKIDCLSTDDDAHYKSLGIPSCSGLSGPLCPDHYFASNLEEMVGWGRARNLDLLVTESAGLCNRCSPHVREVLAVCVVDCLGGINTPKKLGPMLKLADVVVVTKGDLVSQAEREVFAFRVQSVNPRAMLLGVNGLTGQGTVELAEILREHAKDLDSVQGQCLRFPMPAALCSYCLGEMRLGQDYQIGNLRKLELLP